MGKNKNNKKSSNSAAIPRSSMSNSSNINESGSTILMHTKSNTNREQVPVPTPAEFPALIENKMKLVVVDKDKMDDPVSTRPFSDSGSTATTTSSSSLSDTKKQVGCYAAALLKSKLVKVKDRKFKSGADLDVNTKQI